MANHLKHDWHNAKLSNQDKVLCTLAEKLTLTPSETNINDIRNLERTGLSQEAISDAVQVIGYFNYINRVAEGLGVNPEQECLKRKSNK